MHNVRVRAAPAGYQERILKVWRLRKCAGCQLQVSTSISAQATYLDSGSLDIVSVDHPKHPAYPATGGYCRDEAILVFRRFYITENTNAPVPKSKANRVLKDTHIAGLVSLEVFPSCSRSAPRRGRVGVMMYRHLEDYLRSSRK
ncbi:hypothetical protein PILCRDRAFT_474498 [Piloderma croceum F 1598]|uniref:Uncharacterized protein n=1 Tax=Piloderma croceum (strain F 1598) TaxID=765440 RepID=A0A0C3FTU0_PILCF|nr:hypothetical protein PILCRDRAFT_474498 [Piloderma croceum F 1598]